MGERVVLLITEDIDTAAFAEGLRCLGHDLRCAALFTRPRVSL